ncbi:hypothetical protein GQ600_1709 [Phytophthora cactorum]|nr:hypothetical protein GQ600_1709 [Phytophthora cactorum]
MLRVFRSSSSLVNGHHSRVASVFDAGVAARLDAVILSRTEFSQLEEHICSFACMHSNYRCCSFKIALMSMYGIVSGDSGLSLGLKREIKQRAKKTGIIAVDRMLEAQTTRMLSYEDYQSLSKGSWCNSPALRAKLEVLLSAQRFLMFPQDTQGRVNGCAILEYLHQLQLSLRVARFVLERVALEGAGREDETLSEKMYACPHHRDNSSLKPGIRTPRRQRFPGVLRTYLCAHAAVATRATANS